jgi:hypothetical protein
MRLAVTAPFLLRVGISLIATVVTCISGIIHVSRSFLALTHAHITGPGLHGRGNNGQGQDENQEFHVIKFSRKSKVCAVGSDINRQSSCSRVQQSQLNFSASWNDGF